MEYVVGKEKEGLGQNPIKHQYLEDEGRRNGLKRSVEELIRRAKENSEEYGTTD